MNEKAFIALLVGLIALGLYLLRPKPDKAAEARIAQLQARLEVLRVQLDSAMAVSDRAAYTMQIRRNAIKTPDFRLSMDSAMYVAQDTTATIKELRVALIKTVEQAEAYQQQVLHYQESVDSLLIAHVAERQAFTARIDTLNALAEARVPTPCTYLGVRCPNRTTAFLLGVGSALVLAVAVAF